MTLLQIILLGVVQGITEFLPVSSSGHLTFVSYLLNLKPSLAIDIFLNTATFLSVLFFFRKDVKDFINKLPYIILGSIPAVIVGFAFKKQFEHLFSDIRFLPIFFLITSLELFLTKYLKKQSQPLDFKKAFTIGLFQAFAILPGVSRSASTIFAGLVLGLSPAEAFKFSFYLFIPASAGALLLELKDVPIHDFLNLNYLISFVITFLVGMVALRWLRKILASHKLWLFAPYVFILSLVVYIISNRIF